MAHRIPFIAVCLSTVVVLCCAQTPTPNATDVPGTTTAMPNDTMTTSMEPKAGTNASTAAPDMPTNPPSGGTTAPPSGQTTKPPTEAPTTKMPPTKSPAVGTTTSPGGGGGSSAFSAGSFFGGIILAVAVLGIGFCGFKFYQSRQDKNYQTL